jgi:hypothetical protein
VHPCQQCPAGARCDDGTFTPANPPDSVWDSTSEGIYRLSRCPPGHILVRDEMLPVFDRCVSCPPYTYSVEPAAYGGKMWATKAEDLKCNDCPKGARYLVLAQFVLCIRSINHMHTVEPAMQGEKMQAEHITYRYLDNSRNHCSQAKCTCPFRFLTALRVDMAATGALEEILFLRFQDGGRLSKATPSSISRSSRARRGIFRQPRPTHQLWSFACTGATHQLSAWARTSQTARSMVRRP